jgi:Kelch motif
LRIYAPPEDPVTGYFAEISLWKPELRQWDTKSVADFMSDFTSTLTHDGRIVMVGGWNPFNQSPIATTAIYNSHTQTFRTGPTLHEPRHRHAATELSDGGVLVVGGETAPRRTTAGVELITAGGWRKTMRAMLQDRSGHTATRLLSGDILVVGGFRYIQQDELQKSLNPNRVPELTILDTVELYNVANDRWSALPPLRAPRAQHSATLLPDGRVMIIGGAASVYPDLRSVAAWRATIRTAGW